MPTPTTAPATLRPEIGGSLEEFDLAMDRMGFIGLQLLPVFEVAEQAGSFGIIPREQMLKNPDTARTSTGNYNEVNFEFETTSYATKEHGLKGRVDDRDTRLYGNYFDAEVMTAEVVRDGVLRGQELRTKALLWNTSTWTGATLTTAAGTAWTLANKASATPIDDVENAVRKVWALTGMWPNTLALGQITYRNLTHTDQIFDRIVSSGAGSPAKPSDITIAMLSAVFRISRIVVAGGAYNSAKEGQAMTVASIWSNDYAMVARCAETNNIKEPCLGRTLHWGADGSQIGGVIETYYDEDRRSNMVRVRHETQEKVFDASYAHLLTGVNGGTAS